MFGIRKDALGASLEKQAVAKAIQTHYGATLPDPHINRFVQAVGAIAHTNREAPGAKRYLDKLHEFDGRTLGREHVNELAMELIHSGLLGVADKAMQKAGVSGHTPLPAPLPTEAARAKTGFVELPESEQTHQPTANEVEFALSQHNPAKIKPSTNERVKPFDMRRKLPLAEALNSPVTDDEKPLPLAIEKGELGAAGKRHTDISRLVGENKSSNDIVQHLVSRYAMSEKNAKAQFARWLKLRAEGKVTPIAPQEKPPPEEPLKLARIAIDAAKQLTNRGDAWFFRVKLARPLGNHKAAVASEPTESTGWRTLADNMEDHGEPGSAVVRAQGDHIFNDDGLVGQVHNPDGPPSSSMSGTEVHGILNKMYSETASRDPRATWSVYSYGHGRLGGYKPLPAVVVRYALPDSGLHAYASVTPDNFHELLRDAPEETRVAAHRAVAHHYPGKAKAVQLARPAEQKERPGQTRPEKQPTPTDLTKGVDPHIAGTRLAYHLMQIIKDTAPPIAPTYNDKEKTSEGAEGGSHSVQDADPNRMVIGGGGSTAHALAKAALRGRGVKGVNGDAYAALGRHLTSIGHPLADAYNWHTMDRSMREDEFLRRFLAQHVTRPEGMSDAEYYRKIVHQFGYDPNDPNAAVKHNREDFAKFWNRLKEAYKKHPLGMKESGDTGGPWSESKWRMMLKRFSNSMYRHATLAEERQDQSDTKTRDATVKDKTGKDKKVGWKDWLKKLWAAPHMKFARRAQWANANIVGLIGQARQNPQDNTLRGALADAIKEEYGENEISRRLQETTDRFHINPKTPTTFRFYTNPQYQPGRKVVTVGSHGSLGAIGGAVTLMSGGYARYGTKEYTLLPRVDGTLTYVLTRTLSDSTSGHGITGQMRARAQEHASSSNLPFEEGIVNGTIPTGVTHEDVTLPVHEKKVNV